MNMNVPLPVATEINARLPHHRQLGDTVDLSAIRNAPAIFAP
jgi:hypothetical protein